MNIYVDVGNTNIKIKWNKKVYIYASDVELTFLKMLDFFPAELKNAKPKQVWVSCVLPPLFNLFAKLTTDHWKAELNSIGEYQYLVTDSKPKAKQTIGSDLIALAVYAQAQGQNVIVANMGTSTTITYVLNGKIKDVIIAPGLMVSFDALIARASLLQKFELFKPKVDLPTPETKNAISVGVIRGHFHLVKGLVSDLDPQAKVILSGGNSTYITDYATNYDCIQNATLLGMELIAKNNQ